MKSTMLGKCTQKPRAHLADWSPSPQLFQAKMGALLSVASALLDRVPEHFVFVCHGQAKDLS